MELTKEFIEKIEEEYLKELVDRLQKGTVTTDQAKEITREFLELTPFSSAEDMETKIQSFTEKHPEFGGLYVNFLKYEDESKTSKLLNDMRAHLKENRLDEALKLVNNK